MSARRVRVMQIAAVSALCLCAPGLRAQQPAAPWPPEGVYRGDAVDTPPKVLKKVPHVYPPDAIRARIEGIVYVACVVLADGSVGETRITKSLDGRFGTDEAAIAALKQWVFSPALKDGKAVPVAIAVQLSFSLANAPRAISWPAGFAPMADPPDTSQWLTDVTEAGGLRIEIRYAAGWTLRKNPDGHSLFVLRKDGMLSTFSVSRPRTVAYSLDRRLSPVELDRVAIDMARRAAANGMQVQSLGFGQAQAASRLWAWQAFKTTTVVTPNFDPKNAPMAEKLFEGIRVWMFEATIAGQAIDVTCFAIVPRSGTEEYKTSFVNEQAARFAQILRAMSITAAR